MYGIHLTSQQRIICHKLKGDNKLCSVSDDSAFINWGLKGLSIEYEKIGSKLKQPSPMGSSILESKPTVLSEIYFTQHTY